MKIKLDRIKATLGKSTAMLCKAFGKSKTAFIKIKAALGVKDGGNLSKASLETLAVIAYNQPVTRAYIDQVRGVDSAYSIGVLTERELITEMGRMDVPGRPRLYGTTEVFLRVFGLSDISELPPLAIAGGESG